MSHFTVAVLTKKQPTEDKINKLMQPFHEYECTGIKDKYVEAIECHGEYINNKINYEKDNKGYNTFEEYLKDYCGIEDDGKWHTFIDGKLHEFTNPNSQWDWFVIGGRWSNYLQDKNGDFHDYLPISSLNIEEANIQNKKKMEDEYKDMLQCFENNQKEDWESFVDIKNKMPPNDDYSKTHEECVKIYNEQPAIQKIRKNSKKHFFNVDELNCSLEEYINKASPAFLTHNVLVEDGEWYGGEMGWFGLSDQEDNWNDTFVKLIEDHKDYWITIVDCHI